MYTGKRFAKRVAVGTAAVAVAAAASASAFVGLPPGTAVNNDPAAGIDPAFSVSGADPTNADVVGGSLVAGNKAVPWSIFRQQETNGSPPPHDQIFSRSFANGVWTTRAAERWVGARVPARVSAGR